MIGGGNTAVEEALYLSNIASNVHLVHRRDKFRAEAIMVDKTHGQGRGGQGHVHCATRSTKCSATTAASPACASRPRKDGATTDLALHGCFIAIGHQPNTEIFEGQLDMKDGYIVTRSGLSGLPRRPACPGVFAAGDVQDHVYRQAVTTAGIGCMAALDAQRFLEQDGG